MDGGHGSGLHVVGDVAQYDTVLQRKGKILGQRYPQAALDVLHNKGIIICMSVNGSLFDGSLDTFGAELQEGRALTNSPF